MINKKTKARQTKHGLSSHILYKRWDAMKQSATNRHVTSWPGAGALGIEVCEEWNRSFLAFYNWALDNGWQDYFTLCRKDILKNFCPENCYFKPNKVLLNKKNKKLLEHI